MFTADIYFNNMKKMKRVRMKMAGLNRLLLSTSIMILG